MDYICCPQLRSASESSTYVTSTPGTFSSVSAYVSTNRSENFIQLHYVYAYVYPWHRGVRCLSVMSAYMLIFKFHRPVPRTHVPWYIVINTNQVHIMLRSVALISRAQGGFVHAVLLPMRRLLRAPRAHATRATGGNRIRINRRYASRMQLAITTFVYVHASMCVYTRAVSNTSPIHCHACMCEGTPRSRPDEDALAISDEEGVDAEGEADGKSVTSLQEEKDPAGVGGDGDTTADDALTGQDEGVEAPTPRATAVVGSRPSSGNVAAGSSSRQNDRSTDQPDQVSDGDWKR